MFEFAKSLFSLGGSVSVPESEQSPPITQNPMTEIGVTGLEESGGYIYEEFLPDLKGDKGKKKLKEMAENDDVAGAILFSLDSLLRAVSWRVEPNKTNPSQDKVEFVESLMGDMEQPWEDFISEVFTMLVFGYSLFEECFKQRVGPYEADRNKKSQYSDGLIGIRALAPRAQETIERWDVNDKGDILGAYQWPSYGGNSYYLPMTKCLLFRTTKRKNNPEGRSVLRSAYVSYFYKSRIQDIEAIAIERELAGVPKVSVDQRVLTDPALVRQKNAYIKMARDLKKNQQGGIVIPSNCYADPNTGALTSVRMFDVELISASGSRSIDTNAVITRYSQAIARTVLADFIMLGSSSGSFALSKSKTELFLKAAESFLNSVAGVLNRKLLPDLWELNGFDMSEIPHFVPGEIAPTDLQELGDYVSKLAGAGLQFGGDPETERVLRENAGLPGEMVEGQLAIPGLETLLNSGE
ncbi:MAG: hypothetical protein ABFD50_07980 [Smithella sp.]